VPFTSVYTGKYRTEDASKIDTETKHNAEKANKQNTAKQTKLPWFPLPENEVGLFNNAFEPTGGAGLNQRIKLLYIGPG